MMASARLAEIAARRWRAEGDRAPGQPDFRSWMMIVCRPCQSGLEVEGEPDPDSPGSPTVARPLLLRR